VLSLVAQQLPGQPANDPASSGRFDRNHIDLAGNEILDSHLLQSVTPGRPGCSLSLVLISPPGLADRLDQAVLQLSRDQDAQLAP
ncbi:MAG: hypothetical protein ACR2N4_08815, partial [Jatrophihabitans sp.]